MQSGRTPPGRELDPAILRRAQVFVDDPAQAVHSGEINVPISQGMYREADLPGTLGEVVIGKKKRASKDTITVFDSTGLAIQDLAIAKIAMQHGRTSAAVPVRALSGDREGGWGAYPPLFYFWDGGDPPTPRLSERGSPPPLLDMCRLCFAWSYRRSRDFSARDWWRGYPPLMCPEG